VGVDLAAQMVTAAIAVTPTQLGVRYVRACAEHLPFTHDVFDLVFATPVPAALDEPTGRDRRDQQRAQSGWDAHPCRRFPQPATPQLGPAKVAPFPCRRANRSRRSPGRCLHQGCGSRFARQVVCHSRAESASGSTPEPSEMPGSLAFVTVNRTQALVLGFFLLVWVSLLVILVATPDVFDQALRLPTDHRAVELAVLAGLSSFIGLLVIGVVRRWRWMFWLILAAFLFGLLRVPAAVLQLTGILATNTPTWYVTFQALLGVLQFGIGLVMVAQYRRSGVWGAY
jgi:hypothetical protein